MEQANYLGMYLTPEGIYAAVVSDKGHTGGVRCFFVPATTAQPPQSILTAAAREVLQQAGVCEEFAASVRSSLINQYNVHSEFSDARQIESTIRFDVEEAAAADAASLAVAFEVTSSNEAGSEITAYTANRQTLTDILLDLQAAKLDPTVLEPDAVCLARAMEKAGVMDSEKMFLLIFGHTCFLLVPSENFAPKVRTFLLSDESDKTIALARQTVLTAAAMPGAGKTLVLVNAPQDINSAEMSKRTGMQIERLDLTCQLNLEIPYDVPAGQAGGFLFACGSALALVGRTRRADFRRDFMPYQGRRRLLEKSLKVVSVSLTILFVVIGVYFQTRAMRINSGTSHLSDKLAKEYASVMYGKNLPHGMSYNSKLRSELNRVKNIQQYGPGEGSVVARLTYVLEAINSSPKSVDVNIKSLSISERTISLIGDTNNHKSTRELFDAIKKHSKLDVSEERFNATGNREEFVISLKMKEEKK